MLLEHQSPASSITVRMKRLGWWSTGLCEILFWEVCLSFWKKKKRKVGCDEDNRIITPCFHEDLYEIVRATCT